MSMIASHIAASALQTAQAQHAASRKRDHERATESARTLKDLLDLHVEALEEADATRKLPENASEEAEAEKRRDPYPNPHAESNDDNGGRPHVDVTA